jgi:NADPH:quinone reductase-like Zn-dependent oxidoreductase
LPKTRLKEAQIIKEHLENGTFKPLIDRTFGLKDITKAFEYVETEQKVGNVIININ